MLGRRGTKRLREQRDPTERVRQRAMKALAQDRVEEEIESNDAILDTGAAVARLKTVPQSSPRRPNQVAQQSAKVLSFADTPVYRPLSEIGVGTEFVQQVLAVLNDRLEDYEVANATRDALRARIADLCEEIFEELNSKLAERDAASVVERLLHEIVGFGPIEMLLLDETVDDIMVNRPDEIYVERRGRLQLTDLKFRSARHLSRIVIRIADHVGQQLNEAHPVLDGRLPDGSRINIIMPPLSVDGPAISIRKFRTKALPLERMVRQGNLSQGMADLLSTAVRCRQNILVAGGTGSGKTTLLNALAGYFGSDERIVTIEDVAEFRLERENVVRLETRSEAALGGWEVTRRGLLKNALRMNSDRIVLGEVRGDEAVDLLQAMTSGHNGTLSTIHANSARDALSRLEVLMSLAGLEASSYSLRSQIAQAVDLVVVTARGRDGMRRITEIVEVVGLEEDTITLQPLFAYQVTQGEAVQHVPGSFQTLGQPTYDPRDATIGGLESDVQP